ncbi:MAG: DUF423 domain-containing protein [Ferruginibacter sp.]
MYKRFLFVAALLGGLSVAAGAFAAHALKQILSPDTLQVFETAVRYQFYHVFALLAAGILYRYYPGKLLKWSGNLFIAGIILFCGSLYLLCVFKHLEMLQFYWVGAITPLGGLAFITGWLLMAVAVARSGQDTIA